MFLNCSEFNQPLNSWNTLKVTTMQNMFENCSNLDQDIKNWEVSNTVILTNMFFGATLMINNQGASSTPTSSYFNQL